MTGSLEPNVIIVVVVIIRDSGKDPVPPVTTAPEAGRDRTRREHAQSDSGPSPEWHPG